MLMVSVATFRSILIKDELVVDNRLQ